MNMIKGNNSEQKTLTSGGATLISGWYRVIISLSDSTVGGHHQLNLGMPEVPGYLSLIHLPLPDGEQIIDTVIWLRSESQNLTVLNPVSELATLKNTIKVTKISRLWAIKKMLQSLYQLTSDDSQQLSTILGKNIARFRKKGFNGMMLRLYKDYYKANLGSHSVEKNNYKNWIAQYDELNDLKRQAFRQQADQLGENGPLISVIFPVFNPSPAHLDEAVESVIRQIYGKWELCIVDDHSTDPQVRMLLQGIEKRDNRIKYKRLNNNRGISKASNAALEMAEGDYIAFLDHDDLLREHSLLRVAETLHQNDQIRFLYTDEDKIESDGNRQEPHFKPDWNPELLRSVNYICHLAVYERKLLIEVGGLASEHDGAQDYDLVLRVTEQLNTREIMHLPEVLYHWRVTDTSTAGNPNNKRYAAEAGKKALQKSLQRTGLKGTVIHADHSTTYRVTYPLPYSRPLVSIIIPTRNSHELVSQCIDSIREKTDYPNYEIIVVDNGSTNQVSLDYFKSLQAKKLARIVRLDIPFNYSTLNNFGVAKSHGEIIALVNNDIEVINREWLSEMVSLAIRPATGTVGAKLYYSDTKLQHGGVILGIGGVAGHSHKYFQKHTPGYFGRLIHRQNLSAVTAACLVVRKEVYCEVGGLDERNLAVAFNDVDFCLRLGDVGYKNIWTPHAELYHHESVSRGAEDTIEKQTRFSQEVSYMQKRWGERLVFDPAYNPNLTLEHENFALAFPPRKKRQIQDKSLSKQVPSVTELKAVTEPATRNKIQETA